MRTVRVHASQLLAQLKTNRTKHIDEFQDLKSKYLDAAAKKLRAALHDVQENGEFPKLNMPPCPEDHTMDYDRAIRMVEMSSEYTIELTQHEFSQLVMDEWDWRSTFELTKTAYGL